MDIFYRTQRTPVSKPNPLQWEHLADWIARHDRRIPFYHRLCLHAWLWAFRHSVEE